MSQKFFYEGKRLFFTLDRVIAYKCVCVSYNGLQSIKIGLDWVKLSNLFFKYNISTHFVFICGNKNT